MQNSTGTLHAQLQHSTTVLDGFISDVKTLKNESSTFGKSVNALAKDYFKQCKRSSIPASVSNPVFQKLEQLTESSQLVRDQAENLKICLDAVVNRSYKPDLKRADQGKPTRNLVQAEQEAATFETHIRLVESLVASVLPRHEAPACHNAVPRAYRNVGNLDSTFEATQQVLVNSGCYSPLLERLNVGTLRAAAIHLRDQIESPSVRQRIKPLPLNL